MDERIEAVQRMQDYIETHLAQAISLADLAKAAGYRPGIPTGCFIACFI